MHERGSVDHREPNHRAISSVFEPSEDAFLLEVHCFCYRNKFEDRSMASVIEQVCGMLI